MISRYSRRGEFHEDMYIIKLGPLWLRVAWGPRGGMYGYGVGPHFSFYVEWNR